MAELAVVSRLLPRLRGITVRNGRSRKSALAIAGALALGFFALLGSLVLVLRATPSPAPAPNVTLADSPPLEVAIEFARIAARPRATMMVSDGYGIASPPPAVPFAPGLLGNEAFTLDGTMAQAFPFDDYQGGPLVEAIADGSWSLSDGVRQPVGDSSSRVTRLDRNGAITGGVAGASGGAPVPASRARSSASTSGDAAADVSGERLRLARIHSRATESWRRRRPCSPNPRLPALLLCLPLLVATASTEGRPKPEKAGKARRVNKVKRAGPGHSRQREQRPRAALPPSCLFSTPMHWSRLLRKPSERQSLHHSCCLAAGWRLRPGSCDDAAAPLSGLRYRSGGRPCFQPEQWTSCAFENECLLTGSRS